VEFAVQPGPDGILDQCRDVDSDPASIQRVLFFAHEASVIWNPRAVNPFPAEFEPVQNLCNAERKS
jgi:hypothetical protein